jgi:signal transduction histidine kinase
MKPDSSIRARMTAAFTLAVAVLMALTGGGLLLYARRRAEADVAERLRAAARNFLIEVGRGDRRAVRSEMGEEDAALKADGVRLTLRDADGRVVAEAGGWRPGAGAQGRQRVLQIPVGADVATFAVSWDRESDALAREGAGLLALAFIVIAAAAIGAWALVGKTLSPIRALSRQANAASAETLSVSLEPPSRDAEVMELVGTLNGLLGRLSEAANARGRFYAAASHELRTPLQAQLGHLELGLSRERTLAEYRAFMEEARQYSNRLIGLTHDLLFLNRLHAGGPVPPGEPLDLVDVCEDTVELFRPVAEARGLSVSVEGSDSAPMMAAPTHVEMLVRNLIENAEKYARVNGSVRIRVSTGPCRLEVFNDCDEADLYDTEKLFEPFYRPDASRDSETGGNGLGLAICKAIADAGGWSIHLDASRDGFCATVVFKGVADRDPSVRD